MEFLLDNIIWVVIGGIILFSIMSSLLEDRKPSKSSTVTAKRVISSPPPSTIKSPVYTTPSAARGYAPSKGLSVKEKLLDNKIKAGGTIRVRYTKQNGTVSDRTLKPLYIKHENGSMYLRAYCYLRREERTFRLSRMDILS